jgi:enoyl-CoA hydratase/carnithine racemase
MDNDGRGWLTMGVTVAQVEHTALVTMDWPDRRNALGPEEAAAVSEALTEAAAPRDVAVVTLTGNGAFCAGGNLKAASNRTGMAPEERRTLVYGAFQGLVNTLIDLPVPTIAAIDGPAVGMGLDLALACDSRFIGLEAWVSQGWGRVSLVPATGGVLLLELRAPGALWRLLESQPRLDAAAAADLGIAEPATGGTALDRALERGQRLSSMSRAALEAYAELSRDHLRRHLHPHMETALRHQLELLADPEFAARVGTVLK